MVYEIFLQTVTDALKEQLGSGYSIAIRKIPKNNGVQLDGLCISREPESVAPAIYMNSYYEQYLEGMPIEDIVAEIEQLYRDNTACPDIQMEQFSDFEKLKDKIAWKLIHAESNQELLHQLPHIPFLDLAVVFYLFLEQSEHGQMTAMIHREHLTLWETDEGELVRLAKINTPRIFPAVISSMRDVLKEIAKNNLGDEYSDDIMDCLLDKNEHDELYVLTNTSGLNGACCMLYDKVLQDFAGKLDKDLIVLPSSIHEGATR